MKLAGLWMAAVLLPVAAPAQNGWTLTWQDEFSAPTLDTSKWGFDLGGSGWGNNELEFYTSRPENVYIENGMLVIKAIAETYQGRQYTSTRLKTLGLFSQKYGRFEARIRVPYGQGIWPAFWMLGDDILTVGWPTSGEIDIMENIGKEPAIVHGTVHGPGYSGASGITGQYSLPAGRLADDFHVFAIEWEPTEIRWYVDGVMYHKVTSSSLPAGARWVFDHPFHMLLNLAVGGGWPGNPDATTVFPQMMQVDYVRVYRRAQPAIAAAGVVNGASFQSGITAGSWVTIAGTDLAQNARLWRGDEIVDGKLPTSLDGTSVTINGMPAYVEFISPSQINVQAPDAGSGPVTVTVINNGQTSATATAQVQPYSPAFFLWVNKYAVATRADFTWAVKNGTFPGTTTIAAKPGDVIILWGTGFGPVTPAVLPGQVVNVANTLVTAPVVRIGGTVAKYLGGALTEGNAGLYQIAIEIPAGTPDGDQPVKVELGSYQSPDNVFLTIAR